jgi:phospholipid/cholesterol/gamma-HCH transport system ATP-binding protein
MAETVDQSRGVFRQGQDAAGLSRGAAASRPSAADAPVIKFDHVSLAFDDTVVLRDVSFTLLKGHTKIILGASGAGKSISLKLILGLLKPDGGEIWVNGQRVDRLSEDEMMKVRADLGMVFQEGALFDSLTVAENVGYKLYEETDLPLDDVRKRVEEVLGFVRLAEFIDRKPSELSGGQRRRVAIARALAVKPGILLYDEPTTGLDPITADTIDEEIVKLRDLEEVSSILVTHQLRDAFFIATHEAKREADKIEFVPAAPEKLEEAEFMMLKDGGIIFEGTASELRASKDPYIQAFLS